MTAAERMRRMRERRRAEQTGPSDPEPLHAVARRKKRHGESLTPDEEQALRNYMRDAKARSRKARRHDPAR